MANQNSSFITELSAEWQAQSLSQKWLYVLYLFLLAPKSLSLIRAVEGRIGLSFFAPISDTFLIIIAVIGSISIFAKKIKTADLLFLLFIVAFYFFSAKNNPNTAQFAYDNASFFIWSCLPLYLVGLTLDKKTSPRILVAMSYIVLAVQLIFLSLFGVGKYDELGKEVTENMTEAYRFLPFVCILFWDALNRGGWLRYAIAFFAAFLQMSMGNRGSIVALLVFIALYLFFLKKYKYDVLIKTMIGFIVFIFFNFVNEILLFFTVVSQQLGFSTRFFDHALEGNFMNYQESAGRLDMWEGAIKILKEQHIYFDANLYVDRLYDPLSDQYVHNLEVELLCDFGLVGGSIIIAILFIYIYRAFRAGWGTNSVLLVSCFFCATIIQLQFSSSFLGSVIFWFFLGVCATSIREGGKRRLLYAAAK